MASEPASPPARVLRLFARLLGLEENGPTPWRIRSVARSSNRGIRIELAGGKDAAALLLRPAAQGPCYSKAGAIGLCYEGTAVPPGLEPLLRRAAARLRGSDLDRLRRLAPPADRAAGLFGAPRTGPAPDLLCPSDRMGGNPGQWRRFLCGKEFDRMFFWTNPTRFLGRALLRS